MNFVKFNQSPKTGVQYFTESTIRLLAHSSITEYTPKSCYLTKRLTSAPGSAIVRNILALHSPGGWISNSANNSCTFYISTNYVSKYKHFGLHSTYHLSETYRVSGGTLRPRNVYNWCPYRLLILTNIKEEVLCCSWTS